MREPAFLHGRVCRGRRKARMVPTPVPTWDLARKEEGELMANQRKLATMNRRLVHSRGMGGRPGRGTVHTLDCSFLARRDRNEPGILEAEYDDVDAAEVSPTAPRCFFCTLKEQL